LDTQRIFERARRLMWMFLLQRGKAPQLSSAQG